MALTFTLSQVAYFSAAAFLTGIAGVLALLGFVSSLFNSASESNELGCLSRVAGLLFVGSVMLLAVGALHAY